MNCIILGDKFQKRMKYRGCVGLININNKTILQHQYENIKRVFPYSEIIYVYGFEQKRFSNYIDRSLLKNNITTIYNPNYNIYNHGYSLSLAKDYLNDDCFIMFGDHILNYRIFNNFQKNNSQLFVNTKQKNTIGCIINDKKITNISYDLDNYLLDIYYLSKQHSILLQKLITNPRLYNYFIFELFNQLIDYNQDLYPYFVNQKTKTL
jgi:choline kinase